MRGDDKMDKDLKLMTNALIEEMGRITAATESSLHCSISSGKTRRTQNILQSVSLQYKFLRGRKVIPFMIPSVSSGTIAKNLLKNS